MKGTSAAAFSLLTILIMPPPLSAKGYTVKITIKGAGLKTPIEITGPEIREFSVWAGPGVWGGRSGTGQFGYGVEMTEGFIINWSKGIVGQLPAGLQQYKVLFYTGCQMSEYGCRSSEPSLVYVVLYAYSPSTEQGYVYLPGRDDELFKFNHAMWHGHGFEGNWLRATSAWERFVRPLIVKARTTGPSR